MLAFSTSHLPTLVCDFAAKPIFDPLKVGRLSFFTWPNSPAQIRFRGDGNYLMFRFQFYFLEDFV